MNQILSISLLPARAWSRFWFISGSPDGLALFRMLFGFYWLIRWIWWAPHVTLFFSREGMHFPELPAPVEGIHNFYQLIGWLTASPSVLQAWVLYLLTLPIIVMIIAGLFTRFSLFIFLLSWNYHYFLHFHMYETSYDRFLILLCFFLLFSPCGRSLSMDAYRTSGHPGGIDESFPLWTQRLICVQTALFYFGTAVHKLMSPAWNNGDNMASTLISDYSTQLGFWFARQDLPLGVYDIATVALIIFEILIGVLLFNARWQKLFFMLGFGFHLINTTVLWIPQFLIVPCTYVLFLKPDSVREWISRQLTHRLKWKG